MTTYDRVIETGLPNERKYREMISSVVGQLSDGAWENCSRVQGYWIFAGCDRGSSNIAVSNSYWDSYYTKVRNPYKSMSDEQIRKYFGKKIKQLAIMEMQDDYKREVRNKFLGDLDSWLIPKDRYDEYMEKLNAYGKYLSAHPFVAKGKFNANSDYELGYISYEEHITVGDAYKAYRILMK